MGESQDCYNFIGGHREDNESFFECLSREIHEELDLQVDDDYDVIDVPCKELHSVALSKRASEDTSYTMQLFAVKLSSDSQEKVSRAANNRWINRGEVNAGVTRNGESVSAQVGMWLNAIGATKR